MKIFDSGLSRAIHPVGERRKTVLNQPSKEALALSFYHLLPTDPIALLRWRIYCRERCLTDLAFRGDIMEMCRADVVFFAATFVYTFEPRPRPRNMIFNPWGDQVDLLAWCSEVFGVRDAAGEKSRGVGASVCMAILFYHAWLFVADCKLAMLSKDESSLDGPDANTLLGKVAYIHDHMPAWFRHTSSGTPVMRRTMNDHTIRNMANGSMIVGYPSTDQKVRSLRFTAMLFDEVAFFAADVQAFLNSSVHCSPCRFFISTFNGAGNAFYDMTRVEQSTALVMEMYWQANPERWKGAYTTEAGRLKILDPDYKFPTDYPFVLDGLVRSAYIDFELRRAGAKMQSALEELYGVSADVGRKFFRNDTLKLIAATLLAPRGEGDVVDTGRDTVFKPRPHGPLALFADVGEGRDGPFTVGCDIGFGRGASYSTMEAIDLSTGTQVLDYADNEIDVIEFTRMVFAVCRWLNGSKGDGHTLLSFENNGDQGTGFGQEMIRLGYGNIRRRAYRTVTSLASNAASEYHGHRNRDAGLGMFTEVDRAVRDGELIITSPFVLAEMERFDRQDNGKPLYPKGDKGHGDRTMALAMAWDLARERLINAPLEKKTNAYSELTNWSESKKSWSSQWQRDRAG